MEIGRRRLLGLGAGAAVAALASSCSDPRTAATTTSTPTTPPRALPGTAATAPHTAAFPGQPPPGEVYFGASLPHYRSLTEWERELGATLAVNRSFFNQSAHSAQDLVRCCRDDLANGRLPHVSMKPRSTWADLADGSQDAWLESMLAPLRETQQPIFLTLHHEPENDAGRPGMRPADFVAMQRHLIDLASRGSSQVLVVPVLQQWTFDPVREDVDPGAWLVPESPVQGLDVYNHWSPVNGKPWRSFGGKIDETREWLADVPLVIGEYGCREDPLDPGLTSAWLRDAADYAREHDVVAMSYYNSRVNSPEGTWELGRSAERAFSDLLRQDWVARIA